MAICQNHAHPVSAYNLIVWALSIILRLFYKEISTSGLSKVPTVGPTLFVAAPHSNDVVDPVMLSSVLQGHLNHPVSFLAAERLMRRRFIAMFATALGAITLHRVWDGANLGRGRIYSPDIKHEPQLIKGRGTHFDQDAKVGDFVMIVVAGQRILRAEISEIRGPQELYLKRGFAGVDNLQAVLTDSLYSLAPKRASDNTFHSIFATFRAGGTICIFPEGTTHDQPDLLPLKTGFAVMALTYLAANPHSNLNLVPCAIHHVNGHKFRSRAAVEFGAPIKIPKELIGRFKNGEEKDTVKELTSIVYRNLKEIVFKDPDSQVLELAQTLRRLYDPNSGLYSMNRKTALNQRILKFLSLPQNDHEVENLLRRVNEYDLQLRDQGIRDHQVRYAVLSREHALVLLFFQIGKLILVSLATAPGLILFTPVLLLANSVSKKKAKLAVATSPFKIQGRDVLASWKMMTALLFTPLLFSLYVALLTYWVSRSRWCSMLPNNLPFSIVAALLFILILAVTFLSLHTGEYVVGTLRSLRPLLMLLRRESARQMKDLFDKQLILCHEVRAFIDCPSVHNQKMSQVLTYTGKQLGEA